ncbi:MAG: hypothetical protein IPK97_07005 [Ahniella sp.]|nr:hypothetical protein [Ahniella sp.]
MTLTRILMILILVLAAAAASALPPRGGPGPDHPRPDLGRMLGLDGEALAKIDALTEQQHLAVFRLHREQMRAQQVLHEQFQAELAKILTTEQMQSLKQHRQAHREHRGQCAQGRNQQMPRPRPSVDPAPAG